MAEQFDLFAEPEETQVDGTESPDLGPRIIYFDLETQKGVDEVGGWGNIHLMKMAVGVVWDSRDQQFFVYRENDAIKLAEKLRTADMVVGFNVIGFDYTVLQPYINQSDSPFDLQEIHTFDMLLDVKKILGFRLSLNHLAQYTLNAEKSADGLISLQWFKEGKMDQIIEYCKQDVAITRDLFLFGEENGFLQYKTKSGNLQRIEVNWKVANLI